MQLGWYEDYYQRNFLMQTMIFKTQALIKKKKDLKKFKSYVDIHREMKQEEK
jgi:hypothetical protein